MGCHICPSRTSSPFHEIFGLDLFKDPSPPALWYLRCLFLFVLMCPIIRKIAHPQGLAILLCFYTFTKGFFAESTDAFQFFYYGLSSEGLFYFTLGIYLYTHPISCATRSCRILSLLAAIASFILLRANLSCCRPISKIVFIVANLLAIWCWMPSTRLPKWLTSSSFAIYVSHQWVQGIVKFLPLGPLAYKNIADSVMLWFFWVIASFSIPLVFALLLGRSFPNIASIIYGGRVNK